MTRAKRTGVRLIEEVEGGAIAWLYPGGADLDDVLLLLAAYQSDTWRDPYDPYLPDDGPTFLPTTGKDGQVQAGYYRRFPWCHCGEGHAAHYESVNRPGPGAMLGVEAVTW